VNACTLQITSGVGPVEVRLFVARLVPALAAFLRERGLEVGAISTHGDAEAPNSATLTLVGDVSPHAAFLTDLVGTHAWICRSPTRGRNGRKRWFVGVSLHTDTGGANETPVALDPADLEIRTCRSGGAGGQHVNTTDSAVIVFHRPSGLRVRSEGERSQHANREAALARLTQLLTAARRDAAARAEAERRRMHTRVVRGAPVRVWTFES
jgi:putative peptide chain release factor H